MDNKRYSIHLVEQIVGIPRTKIRHYLNKRLLDVEKDEQSGYYFYSRDDLTKLCQIVYYRERLGFSIEKVEQLLETSDITLIESITEKQLAFLSEEIKIRDQQHRTLIFTRKMLDRQRNYRDKLTLVPLDTAYLVPYAYYYAPDYCVYPILYGCSEFALDNNEITHVKKCCLVFDRDSEFVDPEEFELLRKEAEKVDMGMCIHTVTLTDKNVHDPVLLEPSISWAAKHGFRISGRIFLTHFFPYYAEDTSYSFVEAYLPIDIPQ